MMDVMYGCGSDYDNSEEELPEIELKAAHERIIAVTTGKEETAMDLMTELSNGPLFEDSEEFDELEVRFDSSPLYDPYIISSSKPTTTTTTTTLMMTGGGGLVKDSNNNNVNSTMYHSSPMNIIPAITSTTRSKSQSNTLNNISQFNPTRVTFVTGNNKRTIDRTSTKKSRNANHRKNNLFRQETAEYYSPEFILKEGLKKRKGSIHHMHKPYVCPVPGCGKYYKNPNGIKYHAKYGHSAPQEFPCHCGKMYSTRHGLMAHRKIHGPPGSGWPPYESKNNWKQVNKM